MKPIELKEHAKPEEAEALMQMLEWINPLGKRLQDHITRKCYPLRIRRGELLIKPGEISTHTFFICSGVIRGYIKDGGAEITTWITAENNFATAIHSFFFQVEAIEYLQALEDCELLAFSFTDLEKTFQKFPSFNIVARKIYQKYYADAENRALLARMKNADLKYQHFLQSHGDLANRIPIKYIASYMGIASETLSRLRSKKASATRRRKK
ncbi:MAG: Crp/Fnr family transcriptional regulator [Chitinophagaceae bacterium]|nr:Crp/Fnr family transcriptional regulator [Chitinophagaceae bacterium]